VRHRSPPEQPASRTGRWVPGQCVSWRLVAYEACGKGWVRAVRTKRAHDRPRLTSILSNGCRLRRCRSRRAAGHRVLVHGRRAPAGARPGEKSSCLRPRRTELAIPMCRTRWFRRVMGMPWTDERPRWRGPSPDRLSCHMVRQPRGHASTASGHGAPATGAPVRINGAMSE
jgi:hypothetical protein